ncbi:MAG: Holliday junction resolvase RuvX [Verrucomicrobia bacterium]|nr:Holliday junction resolvase RuvX [Verrucomicrobiota bacterium]MBT4901944.1 Holliday junction resolvase RuvX [Verrucomicrobiota bacterium]MBT6788281.1 Holliday junction resolvase RuvX [Verrucomicrobiota bacterium]MBT7910372.1 Holliday junction resolvase RuvX [Verrucomicrobiota bacterium]
MRVLAIDHGTVRMGIAMSDELKIIAQPLEFIPAEPFSGFLDRLKDLLQEYEVELILLGLPRNMDGSYGEATTKVREFEAVLKNSITVPVKTWDERLTSVMANRSLTQGRVKKKKKRQNVDSMSAAILLQSYLDGLA